MIEKLRQLWEVARAPYEAIDRAVEREATRLIVDVTAPPAMNGTNGTHRTIAPTLAEAIRVVSHAEFNKSLEDLTEIIETVESVRLVDDSRTELLRLQLASRRLAAQRAWRYAPPKASLPLEPAHQDFDDLVARMRAIHPALYPTWARMNFVDSPAEFARRPETSCAIGKREADAPFAGFVAPYLDGRVLDVGCGPYALPVYLEEYPVELIYGIDPLEPFEPHPFTFARSFSEFLPFPDASFQTVTAATSLDHSLSLDRALTEIRRVIEPGGTLLVWDGFVKGSPRYNPSDPGLQPVDSYHYFHFDEASFEEVMAEHGFTVREKLAFDPKPHQPEYCISFFYSLRAQ